MPVAAACTTVVYPTDDTFSRYAFPSSAVIRNEPSSRLTHPFTNTESGVSSSTLLYGSGRSASSVTLPRTATGSLCTLSGRTMRYSSPLRTEVSGLPSSSFFTACSTAISRMEAVTR